MRDALLSGFPTSGFTALRRARAVDVQLVEVRLPLSLAVDGDEPLLRQLADVVVDRLAGDADVVGQPLLARKALALVPRVGDGVGDLRVPTTC